MRKLKAYLDGLSEGELAERERSARLSATRLQRNLAKFRKTPMYRQQAHEYLDTLTEDQLKAFMAAPTVAEMLHQAQEEESTVRMLPPPMNPQIGIDMLPKRRVYGFFDCEDDPFDEDPHDEFWDFEFWRD